MADNLIIRISSICAEITDSKDKSLGVFGISQIISDWAVGTMPTCVIHINDGTEFTQTNRTKSNVMSLISKQNTDNLHIKVTIKLNISGNDNQIVETIFNGVITSITMSYDFVGSGRSNKGIVITAIHRFADLYKFGAAGMIYAPANMISDATVVDSMLQKMSAEYRSAKGVSSSYSNSSVVNEVLERCVPDPNSSRTHISSITDAIYTMVDVMMKGGIIVPEKTDPKIREYVKGTITPNVNSKFVSDMYRTILNLVFNSVAVGNLADSIVAICGQGFGFNFAPRSVDYISILPSSYVTAAPKNVPTISTDRYQSITYKPLSSISTDVQGVLVTKVGSDTFSGGQGSGIIRAKFPEDTGSEAVRWKCIPAPTWTDGASLIYGNTKDTGDNQKLGDDVIREVCTAYAADTYYNIRYSKNSISMVTDMRSLTAYTALGGVFDIEYPADQVDGSDKIRATLQAYQFTYRASDEMSGASVSLGFTNAHSSALPVVAQPKHMLYSIKDSDKITAFPDLSKWSPPATPKK